MARLAIIGLVGHSEFFEVPRFHAGGETITAKSFYEEWGGKGFNQAVAAARQDAAVAFLGAADAADAKAIGEFCRAEGVTAKIAVKKAPTARAAILTDGTGETRVTVFPGAQLSPKDVDGFAGSIATADYLLLNNEIPEAVNLAAVEIAKRYGVKIIYNPAPARPLPKAIYEAVEIFTPNEFELAAIQQADNNKPADPCCRPLVVSADASACCRPLVVKTPTIVTTLGARGCRIEATGEIIAAPKVAAIDSTGAGDTFNAVLAVRLAEGESIADACRAAVAAASESVTKRFVLPSLPYRGNCKTSLICGGGTPCRPKKARYTPLF